MGDGPKEIIKSNTEKLGPMVMLYNKEVGWVAEKLGPKSGHWKRLGMAMGRVRAEFFYTRTRPAGLSQKPKPSPFIKRVFFLNPKPAPSGLCRPCGPHPFMPSQAQNQNHKLPFMIFRPKITNTNINTD